MSPKWPVEDPVAAGFEVCAKRIEPDRNKHVRKRIVASSLGESLPVRIAPTPRLPNKKLVNRAVRSPNGFFPTDVGAYAEGVDAF